MKLHRGLILVLACSLIAAPGQAAQKFRPAKAKAKPAAAARLPAPAPLIEGPPPPYEPQLLRLAELMGALTYLRDLCQDNDGPVWRAKMAGIIEAESASPARKERLAGAFNEGFRGYETTYRTCTPNAVAIIARSIDEGARLAHEIGNRYGGE